MRLKNLIQSLLNTKVNEAEAAESSLAENTAYSTISATGVAPCSGYALVVGKTGSSSNRGWANATCGDFEGHTSGTSSDELSAIFPVTKGETVYFSTGGSMSWAVIRFFKLKGIPSDLAGEG